MGLIVDDIIMLPKTIWDIIMNTLAQTVSKVAWTEYGQDIKKILLRARNDYENKKIDADQYKEVEAYVFKEIKIVNQALASRKQ